MSLVYELRRLDRLNLAAALRIIHMFGHQSLLSDRGLTAGPNGETLLTGAEVKRLLNAIQWVREGEVPGP
ncbi:hypothetical protein GCM10011341_04860 [Frigidibacter albus]|uniref:hypothetical protein n=1 Tax=Frigidibacter albus TaxID=1465486 RepID=UPI0013D5CAEE|nr:hypothetical protein [Frigidibacter albus]GGH45132.1 hypothetical protein GCM10011341_04860 [Frigidibacter albus]